MANLPTNPTSDRHGVAEKWTAKKAALPLFRVRDWETHFESADMVKYKRLYSVRFPNKHDGKSYAWLCGRPDPLALFGAFVLVCQLASRAPVRGYLCDEDGPWTAREMALMARMTAHADHFQRVLDELSGEEIDWLERATLEELAEEQERQGERRSTGTKKETVRKPPGMGGMPGKSTGKRPIPADSPSHDAIPGQNGTRPEEAGGNPDRIGLDRTVPPSVPLTGDQRAPADASLSTPTLLEKKEKGGAPGDRDGVVAAAAVRLAGIFDRKAGGLGAEARRHLWRWAEQGLLPLEEADWLALKRYYTPLPRPGETDERRRRQHAETLAEHLGAEVDAARRFLGAGVRTVPAAEPDGWREAAAALGMEAADWDSMLPQGKAAIRRHLAQAQKKEGGAAA